MIIIAGFWRCSLGWMAILIATITSLAIHSHSREGTREKRMSTFRSRLTISDWRVCGSIFKNYLPTPMTRSFNNIICSLI
jgi:hypothetical protein